MEPGPELLSLAAAQGGVLDVGQAERLGVGRHSRQRLLREGRWYRVAGPVLAVAPGPPSWTGRAWTGILLGGTDARLAGLAAAHLHGLAAEPELVEVLTSAQIRDRGSWTFRRDLGGVRLRPVGEPPRTDLADTVLDLCEGATPEQLVDWVTRAVQSRGLTPAGLQRRLDRRSRHGQRAMLTEVLDDVGTGAESALELRYLRDVERAHGLPRGERQHRQGRYRRDVAYPAYRLVVELDGRLGHEGLHRFRDMQRDNLTLLQGELTLRFGFADVAGVPCLVALQVAEALHALGWLGQLVLCPRCRLYV